MFSKAEKSTSTTTVVHKKATEGSFFRKAGEDTFFGAKEASTFFTPPVQAKLNISSPDDPQEKEADAVAEQVMKMPESAPQLAASTQEERLDKKEEEEEIQTYSESPVVIRRKVEEEEVGPKLYTQIQRFSGGDSAFESYETVEASDSGTCSGCQSISLKSEDTINRSGRGPPAADSNFEQQLSTTKGAGSALPENTRTFMESRFNADFSGVRIHTGSSAEIMSRSINAQAFAHGSDIYFNSGKYSPNSGAGNLLLAHELTHTIQQGAVKTNSNTTPVQTKSIQKKIQRSSGGVPSQLSNAVDHAKSMEGKINANKEGPDGYRVGWENLLEIFKSTFGEDKIVKQGGPMVQGAVSEQDIKKQRFVDNQLVAVKDRPGATTLGRRDAMPSWCGIFVFWALNKGGAPMKKWELGGKTIDLAAGYPGGYIPKTGDIAFRGSMSHYAIVESVSGNMVKTVNGNTSGDDNMGAQVQTQEHPISHWTGFFNPLLMLNGPLGSGDVVDGKSEETQSLEDLRKEIFNVSPKTEEEKEDKDSDEIQTKPELSNYHVNPEGEIGIASPEVNIPSGPEVQTKEENEEQKEEKEASVQSKPIQLKSFDGKSTVIESSNFSSSDVAINPFISRKEACTTDVSNSISEGISQINADDCAIRGPPVQSDTNGETVQRSVLDDALSYVNSIADCAWELPSLNAAKACALRKAQQVALHIPGYRALRVVLGSDPITGEHIDRNGHNFIEAAFDIMPGGRQLHTKLNELHKLDEAANWIDTQIGTITSLVNGLTSEFSRFWNDLGISDLGSPMDVIRRGGRIVLNFIDDVIDFAVDTGKELLEMVKNFLLTKIVDFIKEETPAYPLLTVILGKDPITEEQVARNGTNILNALLELGGEEGREQRRQMEDTGTFARIAGYIDEGIEVFSDTYDQIVQAFHNIWDTISIGSLMDPVGTFQRIYNQFASPIRRIWDFVEKVGREILKLIKEVLMGRLSAYARTVRGYSLVTVLIGKDPFTDERVPRSVRNIIKGFMSLMEGGEEQFNQMEEAGAIGRATRQINAAVARLNMTPQYIIQLFVSLWNSFSLNDLAHPIEAFQRIIAKFGEPIGRLIAFVVEIVKIVIRVILEIMNFPFDLINNIITRSMAAFDRIKRDPIGFLKNLLKAIKQGFIQFFNNIGTHLINGVVGWLMAELRDANVPAPQDFTLQGIISWVLQVLGISMEAIWQKLAEHPRIGPERVARIRGMINTLEGIWTFIQDVRQRGMAAIWDKIKEQLSNLWDMVLSAIKNWIMERIITQVTTKLLSMLDPTGIMAVINSAIAIYKAVQSFIKYLREMLEIVNSFVNGVADIAEGNVTTAANYLENTMGRAMPIVIGFLANQVGLGGIGQRIAEIIANVRAMVDRALTWLVNKAVDTGMALLDRLMAMGRSVGESIMSFLGLRKRFRNAKGENHTLSFSGTEENPTLMIQSTPQPLEHYIATLKTSYTTPAAIAKFAIIDNHINQINTLKQRDMSQERGRQIQTHLDGIATTLRDPVFGDNEIVPPSTINWTSESKAGGVVGHIMEASPLSMDSGGHSGSEPATSGGTELWEKVKVRTGAYVQGHLLNHHVHGSGAKKENLVPITGPFNTRMESSVETYVKNRVLGSKEVLHYRVEAVFGSQSPRTHIPEEALLPTELKFKIRPMNKKPNTTGANAADWEVDQPTGSNLDNAPPSMTHDLPADTAPSVAATLSFTELETEARNQLNGANPPTWSQFRNKDVLHERSVTELSSAEQMNLEAIFTDHYREQDKEAEMARVDAMTTADDITTWQSFKSGRAFYNTPDGLMTAVQTAFNQKQRGLRDQAFNSAEAAIPGSSAGTLWIDFKVDNKINFRLESKTERDKVSSIQSQFEQHQNSLGDN